MSQIDTLAGFYHALKETPGDPVTLLALADWFEDNGQPDSASCVRWTLRRKRFPFEFHRNEGGLLNDSPTWHDGWFWWTTSEIYGSDWGHPVTCRLPTDLWKRLKNHLPHDVSVMKHFPSLQAAYEALFDAWPLFPPSVRERW